MTLHGPLAGRTIVVTRPQAQAAPLVEAIVAAGGTPLIFPLLEISPPGRVFAGCFHQSKRG